MIRRTTIGMIAAGALLALPATGSGASTNVTTAIKSEDKIVKSNPEYKELDHLEIKTVAQAKAAIPKLKQLEGLLNTAGTTVAKASATSQQKAGQADWVTGAHESAKAVGDLASALQDIVNGNKTAADKEIVASEKLVKAANAIGDKGDKLLGLPTSD